MTAEEVKALPIAQKIQIMEALWEDLRDRFDRLDLPESQKKLLDERRTRVEEGSARLHDWDSVKATIGG
jgi:putative addiction module component (TIGR02574 family)